MARIFKKLNDLDLIALIKGGAVGVLPTDTVYGLVCLAANQEAASRLYALKNREHKPGTVIAASTRQLEELGIKHRYLKAVEHYWPNPISIIIPVGSELEYLHIGAQGLAIRIPQNANFLQFLETTGPLLTSSANQPGKPPANNIQEAMAYFGNYPSDLRLNGVQGADEQRTEPYQEYGKGAAQSATQQSAKSFGRVSGFARKQAKAAQIPKVDFYVDGGDLSDSKPSTIIRIVDDAIEVIREGAIKIDENGRISQ